MQNSILWVTKQNTEVGFWPIAIHYGSQRLSPKRQKKVATYLL
jgi:hypothetical protein